MGQLWKAFPTSLARLAEEISLTLGESVGFRPEDVPLVEGDYVGPGYGRYSAGADHAMRAMAEKEGILLDPVYTGKAFAGLLDLVDNGRFGAGEHVIFLHTGGSPAVWAGVEPGS